MSTVVWTRDTQGRRVAEAGFDSEQAAQEHAAATAMQQPAGWCCEVLSSSGAMLAVYYAPEAAVVE